MKEYTKKLIRLHFKDNPIFEKLSDERKELLYEKYILVYSILPIDAKLFYKRRVSVNNAILHLISNNMACCLNGTYIYSLYTQLYFPRHALDHSYPILFDFSKYSKECVPDRLMYFLKLSTLKYYDDPESIELIEIAKKMRYELAYREIVADSSEAVEFYDELLPYIAAYCVINEEVFNLDIFIKIVEYLIDNLDELYSYYIENFNKDKKVGLKLAYFPNYLYEKYKEGSNKKVIL